MAQIFISHSARDTVLVNYFSRLGARTRVRLVFEELEKLIPTTINAERIRHDIAASNAMFLLLSRHVETIPHTRDWILWESGVGHNKDIWVFESLADAVLPLSVVTPFLRHYVVFEPSGDVHFSYLAAVLDSYDDSHVLGTMLATGTLGAAFGPAGALVGGLAGAVMSNRSRNRPPGLQITCFQCSSSYSVHLPDGMQAFRCPACNTPLSLL